MGLSKSKESYDVSNLQAKIAEENAYGSIREDGPNLYAQFNQSGDNERDIDIINKGETRKERIIRFGPEKRKSVSSRGRVPSNTPVNEADEEILKEIVEKVKSGGAVVVVKPSSPQQPCAGEEERRCSVDENPVAPIQQVIEDFERRIREDSVRRRGSFLGQIYAEKDSSEVEEQVEEKDPLEEVNYKEEQNDLDLDEDEEQEQEQQKSDLNGLESKPETMDPLEDNSKPTLVAPQRRLSYLDKAEFFVEDVPRKDSIETQPLGHRQSIKDNLIEEFNSNVHGIEANRTEFIHTMLQGKTDFAKKPDPLDEKDETEEEVTTNSSPKRKKSDPLDLNDKQISNGQPTDNCFSKIQEIMNRDFEQITPETNASFTYVEYSTSTTINEYPLNVVDTQKPKSKYELKEEKQIPLNTIREIKTDATKLRKTVEEFEGRKVDVQYVYLNEMLLRCLIKLDSVHVGDDDVLKQERKQVVDYVQECIRLLDDRAEGEESNVQISF